MQVQIGQWLDTAIHTHTHTHTHQCTRFYRSRRFCKWSHVDFCPTNHRLKIVTNTSMEIAYHGHLTVSGSRYTVYRINR